MFKLVEFQVCLFIHPPLANFQLVLESNYPKKSLTAWRDDVEGVTPRVTKTLIKSLNLQLCHKVRENQVAKI
jgi:hypothetical protein